MKIKQMDRNEIIQFLNENPAFQIATVDKGQPRVRTLMLHKADETGIYFMTGKFKDLYRQLSLNPLAELCFHNDKLQIRITGEVENLDKNIDLKQEIADARPFMKPWIDRFGLKYMAVFRVYTSTAVLWNLKEDAKPKEIIQLF